MLNKQLIAITAIASLSTILVGCNSDNNSSGSNNKGDQSDSYTTVTLDASSYTEYTYYDLETSSVVTDTDDWDIAVKRTEVILNSNKASAIADLQGEKYDDSDDPIANSIVNATASTEEGDFLETNAIIGDFIGSDVVPAIDTDDVYSYNGITDPSDHSFSAKSDNYYFLTSAEGDSYAKMNVSAFDKASPHAPYAYVASIDFYLENASGFAGTVSNTWTIDFGTTATTCYDFDAGSVVDCTDTEWDLKADMVSGGLNSSYTLYTNGGASGEGNAKVAGPTTSDAFTSADPAKEADISFAYLEDKTGSAFADNSWYAYDVLEEGTHYLWPNFRTYVVDTDASDDTNATFKLQLLSYYHPDDLTSGFLTIRFTDLLNTGE